MVFPISRKYKRSQFLSPLFYLLKLRKIFIKPDFQTLKILEDHIARIELTSKNKVVVSKNIHLEDYLKITDKNEFETLIKTANELGNKKIIFFNATPQGGGVALMRHPLIRLFEMLNVNAEWYVLRNKATAFDITKKKFHNILQAVAPENLRLLSEDKEHYNEWIKGNFNVFKESIKTADVIVIDDPQPSGLIPLIKNNNPGAKIIFRSHIQLESELIDKKGTPQNEVWEFIWNNSKTVDCFVSHPVLDFIPKSVPASKVVLMPATTDPLDNLNRPLTSLEKENQIRLFNKMLEQTNQTPLDPARPYIIQIARFDPSKGISDVLKSYKILREKLRDGFPPQLIICGNGSIDDPDGMPVFEATIKLAKSDDYRELAKEIKIIQLPHIDNMLNALLRNAKIALQLSHKEGFEIKVTEALMKGVPIIAYKSGGIPLQVKDGVTGFLVETGNTKKVAEKMYELLTNDAKYEKMSKQAKSLYRKDLLTTSNAIRWLKLFKELTNNKFKGDLREI